MSTTTLLPGVRPHPSGTGFQVRVSPFPAKTLSTPDEANEYATELRRRKRQGVLVPPTEAALSMTRLREAADEYVASKTARYADRSADELRRSARPWIEGEFAETPLAGLEFRKLRRYFDTRSAKHPRAAAGEWHVLRGTLELAEEDGESFDRSLFRLGKHARRRKPVKRRPPTRDEIAFLAKYAPEHQRRLFPLLLTLGLRISAMLAIDESWIDFDAKTLTIPSKWRKERGGSLVIPLLDDEVRLFREQRIARGGPSSLMFPRRHGSPWTHSNYWHKVLVPARRKAAEAWREARAMPPGTWTPFEWIVEDEHGRPVLDDDGEPVIGGLAPHDFRRGAATLLPELGMPHEVAAKRLGHKDAGKLLAERYETVRAERLVEEAAKIDAAGGVW